MNPTRARAIALHMDDAGHDMGGLAAQRQAAIRLAVERRAQGQKIVDAVGRLARHHLDDGRVA